MVTAERNIAFKQRANRYKSYLDSFDTQPPVNPFQHARLLLDQTQVQVAANTGISKQALIRLEQGVPDKPIESVLYYYLNAQAIKNAGYDYLQFINGYERFQGEMRYRHYRIFGDLHADFVGVSSGEHTLNYLLGRWAYPSGSPVGRMNVTELSKLLCINQSILNHWLTKPHRQQTIPKVFLDALRTNGYTLSVLHALEEHYAAHREWIKFNG